MSVILLDRDIVHYESLGRGRPIIFLHGWIGSWRYWIPNMQAISISYRAYALDLWGFGETARVPGRYTLDQQVGLLSRFLDQMGIGRVALVGHGLGAIVGILFAQRNPDVVDRVMAVSCPLEEEMINLRLRSTIPIELADWLLGRVPAAEPARIDTIKVDPQAVQVSLSSLPSLGFNTITANFPAACLFVHGQNDPAIALPPLEKIASLPYLSHQIVFEQSGHFPMLDESNKFNHLLTDFLALASGETPRDLQLKDEWIRRVR
jgi:pimeloyl-ACP methyl ester carboxylesterase